MEEKLQLEAKEVQMQMAEQRHQLEDVLRRAPRPFMACAAAAVRMRWWPRWRRRIRRRRLEESSVI